MQLKHSCDAATVVSRSEAACSTKTTSIRCSLPARGGRVLYPGTKANADHPVSWAPLYPGRKLWDPGLILWRRQRQVPNRLGVALADATRADAPIG